MMKLQHEAMAIHIDIHWERVSQVFLLRIYWCRNGSNVLGKKIFFCGLLNVIYSKKDGLFYVTLFVV